MGTYQIKFFLRVDLTLSLIQDWQFILGIVVDPSLGDWLLLTAVEVGGKGASEFGRGGFWEERWV